MTRAPRLSSKDMLSLLQREGFAVISTRGSHCKLRSSAGVTVIVPLGRDPLPGKPGLAQGDAPEPGVRDDARGHIDQRAVRACWLPAWLSARLTGSTSQRSEASFQAPGSKRACSNRVSVRSAHHKRATFSAASVTALG